MKTSLINLPTYIVTILIRKFMDIQSRSSTIKILTRGPWIIEDVINSENIYVYIIGATLAFFVANVKRGLITLLNTKYQTKATGRNKYIQQKKWLQRNNSWLLTNLLGNRENQQKALTLLSAQIPLHTEDVEKHILMESVKKDGIKNALAGEGSSKNNQLEDNKKEEIAGVTQKEESKTSFYSVIEDAKRTYSCKDDDKSNYKNNDRNSDYNDDDSVCNYKKEQDFKIKDKKERGDGESRNMFRFDDSRSETPELFTPSVIRELIPSDGSEDDIPKMRLPVRRKMRKTKKDSRWKVPLKPLHSTVRRTRSGRIYNFGYKE